MNKYTLKLSVEFTEMLYQTLLPFKNLSTSYVNLIHANVYYFLDIATQFPYSFSRFDSPNETSNIRKIVIDKRFIIFFKIIDYSIQVVHFVDGRSSYENSITY